MEMVFNNIQVFDEKASSPNSLVSFDGVNRTLSYQTFILKNYLCSMVSRSIHPLVARDGQPFVLLMLQRKPTLDGQINFSHGIQLPSF